MSQAKPTNPFIRGNQYGPLCQKACDAILGTNTRAQRRVYMKGSTFYNVDRWTGRTFILEACKWSKDHPGCMPQKKDAKEWIKTANKKKVYAPHIVVAQPPSDLITPSQAAALIGGSYHEAFHTLYSRRTKISIDEAWNIIVSVWPKIDDWSKYAGLLQSLNNLVEDIRIENNGCKRFPGVKGNLQDLQDFVLTQERDSTMNVRGHGPKKKPKKQAEAQEALSVVMGAFRDLGLGYVTHDQLIALDGYKKRDAKAYELVARGPLHPLLQDARNLGPDQDLDCFRIAMEIVALLVLSGQDPKEADGDPDDGSGGGSGHKVITQCPDCGAPAHALYVRKKKGSKKGVLTCTHCGYQQEVSLTGADAVKQGPQGPSMVPSIRVIEEDGGLEEGEEGSTDNDGKGTKSRWGGGFKDASEMDLQDYLGTIQDVLNAAASGAEPKMHDHASALSEKFEEVAKEQSDKLQEGEAIWNPANPEEDVVDWVSFSRKPDKDFETVRKMEDEVIKEVLFLRARLQSLLTAARQKGVAHGVRTGRKLSERFLVDSYTAIRSGYQPKRAYTQVDDAIDVSTAVAIVLDQSGSMYGILRETTKGILAVLQPMTGVLAKTMVVGVRDGYRNYNRDSDQTSYGEPHRRNPVHIDVFKSFEESYASCKGRFAHVKADGGTPLSDGMEFALRSLNTRREHHKLMLVFTDGHPNYDSMPVMRWQFRKGAEANIHIVGVGLGHGAEYVKETFPQHVWAASIEDLPHLLMGKLNKMFDKSIRGRGGFVKTRQADYRRK